jgi:hypothetical protein
MLLIDAAPPCVALQQVKASLQYCAAFEAEEEEDAFDLVAAGDVEQEATAQRPQKNMQVGVIRACQECTVRCVES